MSHNLHHPGCFAVSWCSKFDVRALIYPLLYVFYKIYGLVHADCGLLHGAKRSTKPNLGALRSLVLFLCFHSASANSCQKSTLESDSFSCFGHMLTACIALFALKFVITAIWHCIVASYNTFCLISSRVVSTLSVAWAWTSPCQYVFMNTYLRDWVWLGHTPV